MNPDSLLLLSLKVLAVAGLVFLNGFFVAAEFALVKVRETQLDALIAKGQRRARIAREVLGNLDASLSACQLGVTLASLALGWVGEPVFSALLGPLWPLLGLEGPASSATRETAAVVVGFTAITFLHITAGEQAPKWLAIQKPLPIALWIAQPLQWFHQLSYPLIWAVNHASLWLLRQWGVEPQAEGEKPHSEEELRLLLATAQGRSGAKPPGRDLVLNALDLHHRVARDVMRPRREIVGLNTQSPIAQCLEAAEKSRYSRFPLCAGGDLDRTLGVIHIKDLFALRAKARTGADLRPAARKVLYVPETARLERLMRLFLERKLHLAIVVDEYGSTVGMVTLENILEELVGPIQDEFDQEKPLVVRTGEGTWEIDGSLPLHELAELVGQPLREEDVGTASGFVSRRLGGFPKADDTVELPGYVLRVEDTDQLRVTRLRVTRRPPEATG
jgi:CBS domain containing-hemolysin-like protein